MLSHPRITALLGMLLVSLVQLVHAQRFWPAAVPLNVKTPYLSSWVHMPASDDPTNLCMWPHSSISGNVRRPLLHILSRTSAHGDADMEPGSHCACRWCQLWMARVQWLCSFHCKYDWPYINTHINNIPNASRRHGHERHYSKSNRGMSVVFPPIAGLNAHVVSLVGRYGSTIIPFRIYLCRPCFERRQCPQRAAIYGYLWR